MYSDVIISHVQLTNDFLNVVDSGITKCLVMAGSKK